MPEQTNGLHDALVAAVGPIKQKLEETEQEIIELEAELAKKRAERTQARQVLRVLDPDSVPKSEPKKRVKPKALAVSEKKIDALIEHLRTRENGDAFSPRLLLDEGVPMSRATVTNGLHILADRGLIRLDHLGIGASHFYVTTEALRT